MLLISLRVQRENVGKVEETNGKLFFFDYFSFTEMKKVVNEKNSEISELKIVNDQLSSLRKQLESQIDEEKKHFLHRLSIKEKDLATYKKQCDQILQTERDTLEQERRAAQRRVIELENDLERQRRELTMEFESQMKKLEFDYKRQQDDLIKDKMSSELKVSKFKTISQCFQCPSENSLRFRVNC